jgi:hypothetical protein
VTEDGRAHMVAAVETLRPAGPPVTSVALSLMPASISRWILGRLSLAA